MAVNFKFPPDDLVCEDKELLAELSKVIYIGATETSSWFSDSSQIHLRWRVRNQQPYVESVHGMYIRDGKYYISIHLPSLVYEVKKGGEVVNDSRDIVLEWLKDSSSENDTIVPVNVTLNIVKPHTRKITRIGDRLETLWNLLWTKYRGDIPEYTVSWSVEAGSHFSLRSIQNERFKVTFSSYEDYCTEVIVNGKRTTFLTGYEIKISSVEDYVLCVNKIASVVEELNV